MLGRRPVTTPSNAAQVVIPVYTADPHGAAMFSGIVNGNSMAGARPVIDARGSGAFHGRTVSPQRTDMTGAGNLGGGRAVVMPGTRLDQETGMVTSPIQAIFDQRMAARRFE